MAVVIQLDGPEARRLNRRRDRRLGGARIPRRSGVERATNLRVVRPAPPAADPIAVVRQSVLRFAQELDRRISLYDFFPSSIWPVRLEAESLQELALCLCFAVRNAIRTALDRSGAPRPAPAHRAPHMVVELENAEVVGAPHRAGGRAGDRCYVVLTVAGQFAGFGEPGPADRMAAASTDASDRRLQEAAGLARRFQGWVDEYFGGGRLALRAFLPAAPSSVDWARTHGLPGREERR
jgi:hypothetical protein